MQEEKMGELWAKIAEQAEIYQNLAPFRADIWQMYWQKIRMEWNYQSNAMEGNTLTPAETISLLLLDKTAANKTFREHLEMRGHDKAILKIEKAVANEQKISENFIKELHRLILVEPFVDAKAEIQPGQYKTLSNYVMLNFDYERGEERFYFCPPEQVAQQLNSLINWLNNSLNINGLKHYNRRKYAASLLEIIAFFHYRFIMIHPFGDGDGNGRMARLLTNMVLMQQQFPPIIIPSAEKSFYVAALQHSTAENIANLALFLGDKMLQSLSLAIACGRGEWNY